MSVITSRTGACSWATATDWVGDTCPIDNVDSVVIAPDCQMLMNQDQSAYTGLLGLTISGHATTPAMLYFQGGTNGYLKIKSGYTVDGTTGAAKGRLLANADGVWGNTGDVPFATKHIISCEGTAVINQQYLDIACYCPNPALTSVRVYGTKYDFTASAGTVDLVNNTIDLGVSPPADGTPVMITTIAGTLPGGYTEDTTYYVRQGSGTTCKLALLNTDATIVDITSVGSGTCTLFTGHTNTGTATVNVLDDVSGASSGWITTTDHNRACLANAQPTSYGGGQQRVTLATITSTQITVSENVAQALYPGARIYLGSRNVSIRSTGAATQLIYNADVTQGNGVFKCELSQTSGTGTTYVGAGINYGNGNVVSGSIYGFQYAFRNSTNGIVSATICGCGFGFSVNVGCTFSGVMQVRSYGFTTTTDCVMSGIIRGGHEAVHYDLGSTVFGRLFGCSSGMVEIQGTVLSEAGVISGCGTGANYFYGTCFFKGLITGCTTAFSSDSIGPLVFSGTIAGCTTHFKFAPSAVNGSGLNVICRAANTPSTIVFTNRNMANFGSQSRQGLFCEDYGRVAGASYAFLPTGDVIRNTSIVRTGGAASSLEVVPLSSASLTAPILIFEWSEKNVVAAAQTRSVFLKGEAWTAFPLATELYIEAEYISNATTFARTTVVSTAVLTDNTTWTEFDLPAFTPAVVGIVRYRGWLKKYVATRKVYVDCKLVGANATVFFEDGQSKLSHSNIANYTDPGAANVDSTQPDYLYAGVLQDPALDIAAVIAAYQAANNSAPTNGDNSLVLGDSVKVDGVTYDGNVSFSSQSISPSSDSSTSFSPSSCSDSSCSDSSRSVASQSNSSDSFSIVVTTGTDSIQAQITKNIKACLKGITVANGFNYDVAMVEESRKLLDISDRWPYILLLENEPEKDDEGLVIRELSYVVWFFSKQDDRVISDPADASKDVDTEIAYYNRNAIADITKALNVDIYRGYVDNTPHARAEITEVVPGTHDLYVDETMVMFGTWCAVRVVTNIDATNPYQLRNGI